MSSLPEIPLDYAQLSALIASGVYPAERHWLEFKEQLFPAAPAGKPTKTKTPDEVFDEMARDMASLAPRGGYLIYGIHEDKINHVFTVADMELPNHLDQKVVATARTRVDPQLEVEPTLLTNPAKPGHGLMVIHVPESPDIVHNVGGTYYGRSSIGKDPLRDDEVERLILRRGRTDQLLAEAMLRTQAAGTWGSPETAPAHLYLTALPTRGQRDMLADFTRSENARFAFLGRISQWAAQRSQDGPASAKRTRAYDALHEEHRTQSTRGAWFQTTASSDQRSRRGVGLDDDGTVRFFDRAAGSLPDGSHPADAAWAASGAPPIRPGHATQVIYEQHVWLDTVEFLDLLGMLATEVSYTGAWLIGLTIGNTLGRSSGHGRGLMPTRTSIDTHELTTVTRASATEICNAPQDAAERLVAPLLRELGTENLLTQWNSKS